MLMKPFSISWFFQRLAKRRRNTVRVVILLAFLVYGLNTAAQDPARLARDVTIYRDGFGVPHVVGKTDEACVFGFVYAQSEDNFWQVEDNYIRALGRSAEVYGERTLQSDLMNRALEITRLSKEEYSRSTPKMKGLYDAAAAGLNYFLARNPGTKPRLLTRYEPWHILAHNRFIMFQNFTVRRNNVQYEIEPGVVAQQNDYEVEDSSIGSNMFALAPSRTSSGKAMLFTNPHQPFFGVGQWYEGHIRSDSGWNISGCAFFGSPFVLTGFNENLGWAHTVNNPDIADLYREKFVDAKNYQYDGKIRTVAEWTETVAVKIGDGLKTREVRMAKTHHGPVVSRRGNEAISLKLARIEEAGHLRQWYEMSRARDFKQFKSAASRLGVHFLNTIYADNAGNIFYLYGGAIPRRSEKFDWTKPVDGSTAETEWNGYHSIDELPQVLNPPSGFLQNCNSSPFTTTEGEGNPDAKEFPGYMAREPDTARAKVSRKIIGAKPKFTYEEFVSTAYDTRIGEAEKELAGLYSDWENLRTSEPLRYSKLQPALDELKRWNRVSTVDSVAMTLFTRWLEKYQRERLPKITAMDAVISELEGEWKTWRVPWGEVNRLQRIHSGGEEAFSDERESLPIAGAPGEVGIVFNFGTRPERGQKRRYGTGGHSYFNIVEFDKTVKASSLLVFGASADPASPHYFDQARLYSTGRMKRAWLTLSEVKQNSRKSYKPGAITKTFK